MPGTEKKGRRHSSTVTISFVKEPKKRPELSRKDVREDTFRASGNGGQHRNKTDSGIRLTHLPLQLMVTATEDRSQHKNRAVAWERLHAAYDAIQNRALHQETNEQRIFGDETYVATWTAWRNEVKLSSGAKVNMQEALRGNLSKLLRELA